uniref:Uncharacterized protein n=1 Tax=Oryza glumipatula TaxID=40148 RepID=A0A0E0A0G2_9ORYZ
MAATDSRRLADLDVDELDRLLPLIKVTPFAAHRTSAPGGCGCPCAAPRRMEEAQASSERTPNPPPPPQSPLDNSKKDSEKALHSKYMILSYKKRKASK